MLRRNFWLVCLSVTVCLTLSVGIFPATGAYPEKPITMVCWSKPGSSVDLMARAICKFSEKYLGQPMAVLTKSGGGGNVALAYAKKQKADGYTILATTRGYTVTMAWGKAKNISPADFTGVARMIREPLIFAVHPDRPYKTWPEFVDYAKKHPNKITVAVPYLGFLHHTLFLVIKKKVGITTVDVPYDGGKPCVVSVVGGHDDALFNNPSAMKTQIRDGKLRPLFCSGTERIKQFPDVPTLKELGVDFSELHWRGVMVPTGVPQDRINRLEEALKQISEEPEWKEFLESFMFQPGYMPHEEFQPYMQDQIKNFKKVLIEEGFVKK